MNVPDDELMSSLVRELGDDPPLPPELEAEIWTGAQRKIAARVVVTASAAIAVAAARAASTPAAAPLTLSSILSSVAGKVAVAVALAVGAVSGYVMRSVVREPAPAAIAAPLPSPPPPPPPSEPPTPAVVVVEQQPAVDVPRPPAPRQRREATQEAVATEITKRELLLMDKARAALSREDAADALAAVREQRTLPAPRGFDEESEAIEVFALGRLDRARAASAARAFLQKRPDSPLVDRVRSFATVD